LDHAGEGARATQACDYLKPATPRNACGALVTDR